MHSLHLSAPNETLVHLREFTMDGPGGLFSHDNRQQLEASFKEFLARPENRPLVEQHQADEVVAALDVLEQQQDAQLAAQVQALPAEYQQLLQPVLRWPALRRVLLSLTSHTPGDATAPPGPSFPTPATAPTTTTTSPLAAWLSNDRVLALLRQITKALRSGQLTEQQLEAALLQQLEGQDVPTRAFNDKGRDHLPSPTPPAAAAGPGTLGKVVLPSQLLMEALNEHLAERSAGRAAYQAQRWGPARHHYTRALSIVEFVRGSTPGEQREVEINKVATLVNLAAVELATQEYAAAARWCRQALQVEPHHPTALARLAKAQLGLHEQEAAVKTLAQLAEADPHHPELLGLQQRAKAAQRTTATEKQMAARMLRFGA